MASTNDEQRARIARIAQRAAEWLIEYPEMPLSRAIAAAEMEENFIHGAPGGMVPRGILTGPKDTR